MNIVITTQEQLEELAARCIYLLSSYRHWQKDYEAQPSPEVRKFVERDKERIDEFLEKIGAVEYEPLKEITAELKLQIKIENEKDNSLVEGNS